MKNNNNNNITSESTDSIFTERRVNLDQELQALQIALATHLDSFKQHELTEKNNYEVLFSLVKENIANTEGLLTAWNSAIGTIRVLTVVGAIIKWISGVVVGLGIFWTLISGKVPHI